MDSKDLHVYCLGWVNWRDTRKFYTRPAAQNILARLQPGRVGTEPNGPLVREMQFFDSAVSALRRAEEHEEVMACFWLFYVAKVRNIKKIASELGIGRRTFYERVQRGARLALQLSNGIQEAFAHSGVLEEEEVD